MKFKNKTKYTKEIMIRFNYYHLNHSFVNVFIIILAIVLAINSFFQFYFDRELYRLLFGLIYILFTGITKFVNMKIVKRKLKNYTDEQENEYQFYDTYFLVNKDKEKLNYKAFKIKIDKELLYFYLENKKVFIVNSNNEQELIDFIKKVKKNK